MKSVIVDGVVLDFKYKKVDEFTYIFYVGHILVGRLFRFSLKSGWAAVSHKHHDMNGVDGFKTRWKASEYLLKLNKIGGYK